MDQKVARIVAKSDESEVILHIMDTDGNISSHFMNPHLAQKLIDEVEGSLEALRNHISTESSTN